MLPLICNVLFASSFMLCIKWMHNRQREDIVTVGAINYIVAFLFVIPLVFGSGNREILPATVMIGGSMGLCYFIAFFFAINAVKWIGASGSTVVSVLSIVVPIICAIFLWNENPNRLQVVGIGLAMGSLFLISSRPSQGDSSGSWSGFQISMLILFFILCGYARVAQAAYRHICVGQPSNHFTLCSFMAAATPSLILLLARRKSISRSEWGFGIFMGLANALQIQFIIQALKQLDSFIVFPVTSAGALLLTTLVATRFLSERLSKKSYVGIALACVALGLLNWDTSSLQVETDKSTSLSKSVRLVVAGK